MPCPGEIFSEQETHLISNYSTSAGEVAYLLVEAHRACSARWDYWRLGEGDKEGAVCIDADAPSGDMKSAVKSTNRRRQALFLPLSILQV